MNYRAQISKDNLPPTVYIIYMKCRFFAKITFHTIFCRDGDSLDQEKTKYSLMK